MICKKWKVLTAATAVRLLLIYYSEWHDRYYELRYTDIDYIALYSAPLPAKYVGNPKPAYIPADESSRQSLGHIDAMRQGMFLKSRCDLHKEPGRRCAAWFSNWAKVWY